MFGRKVWSILGVVILITCVISVCTAAVAVGVGGYLMPTQWAQQDGQQTLRLYGREPITLDPALAGDANSTEYIDKIFSGLVTLDDKMEVVPELAERWDISNDGRVYTFHLRPGIVFQNGKAVTAHDFKYTIERAADPATRSQVAASYVADIVGAIDKLTGKADQISGVEAVDDRTVRITIDSPKAYFLSKLSYHTFFVVDEENMKSGEEWWLTPNGTGPFKLESLTRDRVLLAANENYVHGAPEIARVSFVLRGGSPMTMYEQGELDATLIGEADVERVLDPTNPLSDELQVIPSVNIWYLAFDAQMEPFDDVKVRQAFAAATNKEGIANILRKRMVTPATGILPPGFPGHNDALKGIPYDPERARQLLSESSYKEADRLPPIVFASSGDGATDPLAAALTLMYSDTLGVNVELQQVDWDHFQQDLYRNEYQMFMLGWVMDYPDPENFLDILFYSGAELNHSRYSNPEVDKLLAAARTEQDRDRRMQMYQQAEETIVNEAAWVPLYHNIDYLVVKPYVEGLTLSPQGEYNLTKARINGS